MPKPENITLDPQQFAALSNVFADVIASRNLILQEAHIARFTNKFYEARKKEMGKNFTTAHKIVNLDLLNGVKSVNTVKSRLYKTASQDDYYTDTNNRLFISLSWVRRQQKKGQP